MTKDKYLFMPSFSLEPNKVTSYNQVFIRDYENEELRSINSFKKPKSQLFKNILKDNIIQRQAHNFVISDNAHRTLKKKINWLYYLAKSKHVKTYSGVELYNFKISFITLTLPSKQRTCTKECNNLLLNTFLTEIRQRTKMTNYVWRLEFQKNGNVHYHIVTDTYIDYYLLKKVWNKILKNNGYIEPYAAKFKSLSLLEYNNLTNSDKKVDFNIIAKRFANGKKMNWESPPSVDVKSVISKKAIANYISKYFSKNDDNKSICNELDTDDNSANLRLWFCSRSLSKLSSVSNFCEAVEYDIFSIVSYCKEKKVFQSKYAKTIYFEISTMTGNARKWLEMILKKHAKEHHYLPAN
jgi:hypothetical protein